MFEVDDVLDVGDVLDAEELLDVEDVSDVEDMPDVDVELVEVNSRQLFPTQHCSTSNTVAPL